MKNGRTSSRASCIACNAVAALYLSPLYSKEAMVAAARSVCISFRLQSPRVCRGLVDSFKVCSKKRNEKVLFTASKNVCNHETVGVVVVCNLRNI